MTKMPYRAKEDKYLPQGAYNLKFEIRNVLGEGGAHEGGEALGKHGVHSNGMYMALVPVEEGKEVVMQKVLTFFL